MPSGVPHAQKFSSIFAIIEPELFNRGLAVHIGLLHPALKRQIIAIDGKRLRGSHGLNTEACHAAKNLGALRRIVLNLLKRDQIDTRSLPNKRRRAMLDPNYRDSLLSLA